MKTLLMIILFFFGFFLLGQENFIIQILGMVCIAIGAKHIMDRYLG